MTEQVPWGGGQGGGNPLMVTKYTETTSSSGNH